MRRHAPPASRHGTEPVTASPTPTAQRAVLSERAAPLGHDISRVPIAGPIQRQAAPAAAGGAPLPNRLRAGIEQMSGYDMSDVRVHRNSPKPAHVDALAYAQGRDIHLAAGQERHLPHEAWHVVQQKQGRVRATFQAKGFGINDDEGLEREAAGKGEIAGRGSDRPERRPAFAGPRNPIPFTPIVQRVVPELDKFKLAENVPDSWASELIRMEELKLKGDETASEQIARIKVFIASEIKRRQTIKTLRRELGDDFVDFMLANIPEEKKQEIVVVRKESQKKYLENEGSRRLLFQNLFTQDLSKNTVNLKPSAALKRLDDIQFFAKNFGSVVDFMLAALKILMPDIDLTDEIYKKRIKIRLSEIEGSFTARRQAIESAKSYRSQPLEKTNLGKRKFSELLMTDKNPDGLYEEGPSGSLSIINSKRSKIKYLLRNDPEFLAMVLKSSQAASQKIINAEASNIHKASIDDGAVWFSDRPSTSVLFGSLSSFNGIRDNDEKTPLSFSLHQSGHQDNEDENNDEDFGRVSFGRGGNHIPGLSTYPNVRTKIEEMQDYIVSESDIAVAMQEYNLKDILSNLETAEKSKIYPDPGKTRLKFAETLMRIENLLKLERFRGKPFAIGVAAVSRLMAMGEISLAQMADMVPMRGQGATTNVNSHLKNEEIDPKLWQTQVDLTIDAIEKLLDAEILSGSVYDQRIIKFLERLNIMADNEKFQYYGDISTQTSVSKHEVATKGYTESSSSEERITKKMKTGMEKYKDLKIRMDKYSPDESTIMDYEEALQSPVNNYYERDDFNEDAQLGEGSPIRYDEQSEEEAEKIEEKS